MMQARPGFTAAAVLMLALGIGMNGAVFSVTNSVLFKGFRLVRGNDRVLYIGVQRNGRGCCASYPDFLDWREQAKSFEGMGAVADLKITLRDGTGYPETFSATQISANGFQLLGQRPIIGRDFSSADEAPGAERVAILTHGFWERRYGGRAGIVGEVVSINGEPTTVIGVMPAGFSFPQNQDLWVPLVQAGDLQNRDVRSLWFAFGRMANGVTRESAAAELETIGNRLAIGYPLTNEGWIPRPLTFTEFFVGRNATMTYGALWGAVGFVLLIACANVANLMLARSIGRSREMSVRVALGAGRWRIVRQLLVESVMLSSIGGVFGWGIAKWGVRTYELAANPPTRDWSDQLLDYTMDYGVLTYLVAISIGTGLLFGLIPALRMWKVDVNAALKEGGRGAIAGGGRRIASLLIVGEMALAIVLLSGAGVMIRSFLKIHSADIGVATANTVTMMLTLPTTRYPDADSQASFYDRLRSRLATIPGIESITVASTVPAGGTRSVPYELAGAAPVAIESRPAVWLTTISPAYFRTVGATVLAGREFNDFDGRSGPVAIVNERFAGMHWPGEDPLGKRLRLLDEAGEPSRSSRGAPNAWLTVVGVVSNILLDVTRPAADPLVYVSYQQRPLKDMWVLARTAIPLGPFGNSVRKAIATVDPDLPIWLGPFTLDQRLAGMGNYWDTAKDTLLLFVFAAMALLLASFGLYAVIAHSVSQRTQEIGIRMAIGATAPDIQQLIWAQGMRPLALGLAIGLAASFGVNQVLRSQLVDVSPSDPATLIVASAVLVVCATLGCLIPARRAIGIDPLVALRDE